MAPLNVRLAKKPVLKACAKAHLWGHARERQRAKWSGGQESGEEPTHSHSQWVWWQGASLSLSVSLVKSRPTHFRLSESGEKEPRFRLTNSLLDFALTVTPRACATNWACSQASALMKIQQNQLVEEYWSVKMPLHLLIIGVAGPCKYETTN